MKPPLSLSILASLAVLAGSVPAALALSSSDMSSVSDGTQWSSSSSWSSLWSAPSSEPTWMGTDTTWMQTLPTIHCSTVPSDQRTACQQQLLMDWQASYRAYRNWITSMDTSMQQQMEADGLTSLQVQNIFNNNLSTTVQGGSYATTQQMRDAWKTCQNFDGRTQARCMRDALTNDSSFESRFQQWVNLNQLLNSNQGANHSSQSSVSSY